MTYLWENYDEHKNFYVPPYDNGERCPEKNALQPYLEIGKISSLGISVNPVLRFWHIFQYLYRNLDKENDDALSRTHSVENVLFHYLAMLDRKSGVHLSSLSERQLHNELLDGCFGQTAERLYSGLSDMDKRGLLIFLGRHQKMQGRDCIFFEAFTLYINDKYQPIFSPITMLNGLIVSSSLTITLSNESQLYTILIRLLTLYLCSYTLGLMNTTIFPA